MARSPIWICAGLYLAASIKVASTEIAVDELEGKLSSDRSGLAGPQHQVPRTSLEEHLSAESATHRRGAYSASKATEAEIVDLLSTIIQQLEPYNDGISLEMVERLYCNAIEYPDQASIRIQVIEGRPYVVGPMFTYLSRGPSVLAQVMNLAAKFHLPDLDFLISTSDLCPNLDDPKSMDLRSAHEGTTNCTRNAPLFAFGKRDEQTQCVTVPDWSFENWPEANTPTWSTVRAWMLFAAKQRPFSKRLLQVFWRGGRTHWQRILFLGSQIVQDSGDFNLDAVDWADPDRLNEAWVSLAKHCDYQRLLHLRGNGYSTRLKTLMLCGSPVIFPYAHDFEEKEFWYHMLTDRHNIMLPPSVTLENQGAEVVAAAEELVSNKILRQEVAMFGQHLAAEVLHPDNIDKYWMELFEQYSRLLSFKPSLHPDALPLEEALLRPYMSISAKQRTCNIC